MNRNIYVFVSQIDGQQKIHLATTRQVALSTFHQLTENRYKDYGDPIKTCCMDQESFSQYPDIPKVRIYKAELDVVNGQLWILTADLHVVGLELDPPITSTSEL